MKLPLTGIAIALAMTLLSCHGNSSKENIATQDIALQDLSKEIPAGAEKISAYGNAADSAGNILHAGNPAPNIDWDKKIIKDATVRLELKDFKSYDKNLHNIIKRYGGYIASEEQTESDASIQNVLTIKVPVAQFEELMNQLPAEGSKVLEKKITTQDVTGEVVDTKARMEAKKQVRQQYIELLKQSKKMSDVLEVQKEINGIQEDIEAGTGRVEYLVHQAAYSSIHLTYFQYFEGVAPVDGTPSFYTRLKDAFSTGASMLSGLMVFFISIWPLLLAVIGAWYILKKRRVPAKAISKL